MYMILPLGRSVEWIGTDEVFGPKTHGCTDWPSALLKGNEEDEPDLLVDSLTNFQPKPLAAIPRAPNPSNLRNSRREIVDTILRIISVVFKNGERPEPPVSFLNSL